MYNTLHVSDWVAPSSLSDTHWGVEAVEHRIFDTADFVLCEILTEAEETVEYRAYNKI
jgi:hypothetical protein